MPERAKPALFEATVKLIFALFTPLLAEVTLIQPTELVTPQAQLLDPVVVRFVLPEPPLTPNTWLVGESE